MTWGVGWRSGCEVGDSERLPCGVLSGDAWGRRLGLNKKNYKSAFARVCFFILNQGVL